MSDALAERLAIPVDTYLDRAVGELRRFDGVRGLHAGRLGGSLRSIVDRQVGRARRSELRARVASELASPDRNLWSSGSRYSVLSTASIASLGSALSLFSIGSLVSIGSAGSILSIGSTGSILSIGSVGSVLSIGSAGGVLQIGGSRRRDSDSRTAQGVENRKHPYLLATDP